MGGNNNRFRGRRLVAALGALTLSLAGAAAATTTASAADDYGNINPSKTGSIVIHKHVHQVTVAVTASPDGSTSIPSDPIEGVTFTAYKVTGIDLTAQAGWTAVAGYDVTSACTGTLPKAGTTIAGSAITSASGVATITPLTVGAYVVCETAQPANVVDKAQPFLVTIPYPYKRTVSSVAKESWLYEVNVYPKNGVATIAKTVSAPSSFGLGATDSFTVTTDIPAIGSNEVFTHYWVKDPMDSRLTALAVPAASVTAGGTLVPATNYAVTTTGNVVTLQFTSTGLAYLKGQGGKQLQVIITGTVSTLGATAISNTASFSVGTKVGSGLQTPDDPTTVATALASAAVTQSWGDLVVRKLDSGDGTTGLGGAVFEVYASSAPAEATCATTTTAGSAISVAGVGTQFTTNSSGLVTIPGLFVSDSVNAPNTGASQRCYVLKEITPPVGYILPANPNSVATVKTGVTVAGTYGATVLNTRQQGVTLPMTGSNGIVVMSVAGLALIGAGLVLAFLARRRKQTA